MYAVPVFLRIYLLGFCEICYNERNPETSSRSGFSRKNLICLEMGKKGSKRTQKGVFMSFLKILLLLFAESNLE